MSSIIDGDALVKTILFQGDSITDAARSRDWEEHSGSGYMTLVKAHLGYHMPGEYHCINRGVSGNRILDILARIKCDIINLAPDYMSILVGVNDVWHEFGSKNGVPADKFEMYYSLLISEVKAALPNIKIMILEPFALPGNATREHWEEFRLDTERHAAAARHVAEKNGLPFVPLQKLFDEAADKLTPEDWLCDGVHPTAAGHELIKQEWLKAFERMK